MYRETGRLDTPARVQSGALRRGDTLGAGKKNAGAMLATSAGATSKGLAPMHRQSTPAQVWRDRLREEIQLDQELEDASTTPALSRQRYGPPVPVVYGPPIPKGKARACDECGRLTPLGIGQRLKWPRVKTQLYLCPDCLPVCVERRLALPVTCRDCGETKPADQFLIERRDKRRPVRSTQCHTCRAFLMRRYNYGISRREYEAMLRAQGGGCAICGAEPTLEKGGRLYVDHCHTTGAIRGLLCQPCNQGLGQFRDTPALLEAAIAYLQRAQSDIPG